MALIGTSAGGGLAFSAALKLVDEGLADKIAGVVSLVPVTIHPDAIPPEMKGRYTSYDEHAENTVNTKNAMEAFFGKCEMRRSKPLTHLSLKRRLRCAPRRQVHLVFASPGPQKSTKGVYRRMWNGYFA